MSLIIGGEDIITRIRKRLVINEEIEAAFNICACICGKDGIISREEEEAITQKFKSAFNLCVEDINTLFDRFFESKVQIDNYVNVITDKELQRLIVDISEFSAAADGMDVRENIALQRTKLLWGLD